MRKLNAMLTPLITLIDAHIYIKAVGNNVVVPYYQR
jgi:hypothetical protein